MAIIALRAWYLEEYEPIREVVKRPHDLRLNKNSLLKAGLRADFLDEQETVAQSLWFQRYLEGETVEFYIEGSGGYQIANIDLVSHEIYFVKQDLSAWLDPVIYISYQQEDATTYQTLRDSLEAVIETLNQKTRIPLQLEFSHRPQNDPLRLSKHQLRQIRKSLVFLCDGTPVAQIPQDNQALLIPSPLVGVELGYALQCKQREQILLTRRDQGKGQYPFELSPSQQLLFQSASDLQSTLPERLEILLQRFNLFH